MPAAAAAPAAGSASAVPGTAQQVAPVGTGGAPQRPPVSAAAGQLPKSGGGSVSGGPAQVAHAAWQALGAPITRTRHGMPYPYLLRARLISMQLIQKSFTEVRCIDSCMESSFGPC